MYPHRRPTRPPTRLPPRQTAPSAQGFSPAMPPTLPAATPPAAARTLRPRSRRSRLGRAALLCATLAWAGGAPAAATPPRTLVYCSEGNPVGLQPALQSDGASFDASSRTLYSRLIEQQPGTAALIPGLATSWEASADGLSYLVHLRSGVRFHSGFGFRPTREFNADDVVFTFRRMLDPRHPYHRVSNGSYVYFVSMGLDKLLASVDKVDDHTVRFVLRHANAAFPDDLSMDFASIDSAEYAAWLAARGRKQDLDLKPIGTGPFELVAYQPDSMIRYRAFEQYWRGRPPLDNLVFAIVPDASVRWAKLRAGECQLMASPNPADLAAMRADPAIRVADSGPALNVSYVAFNTLKPPLNDLRVRKALYLAIRKKAIVDAVFGGRAVPAVNPLAPAIWSYDRGIAELPYDPAQARRLLAEAGYPKGLELELSAMTIARPYLPDARRMAVMIQSDWERIGVRTRVVTFEWGEYLRRLEAGSHQAAIMGWSADNGDPDNFLGTLLSCEGVHTQQNPANFCFAPYQKLIVDALRTSDRRQRIAMYQQAQRIFHQQLPWVPMAHASILVPMSVRVQGYVASPAGIHDFSTTRLD